MSTNLSGSRESTETSKRIASITPTMALSEGPILSQNCRSTTAKFDHREISGSSASTTDSSITSLDFTVSLENDLKGGHNMKSIREKVSNLMRKLRTETTLRKEAEDQNRKIQQEKLVSYFSFETVKSC